MARELVVPWSRARIYFITSGAAAKCLINDRSQRAAQERPDHGHPGVTPVRIDLAGNGQKRVRQPGTEISSGIDGLTGGPSQEKADGKDDHAHQQRTETGAESG